MVFRTYRRRYMIRVWHLLKELIFVQLGILPAAP
jgi:hypothetical protein